MTRRIPRPNAAFILDPLAFEDVYGRECAALIAADTELISPAPAAEDRPKGDEAWLPRVELLFTGWGTPILDSAWMARMPRLRAVFHGAGSVRDLVSDALWKRGVVVSSCAAMNAQPVAEFALGATLLGLKRAWHLASIARRARGYAPTQFAVNGAFESTIGLVSFGLSARKLREHLRHFDLNVIVYDPHVPPAALRAAGVEPVSLEELFARSDVVSLHTPLLAETHGMITGKLLAALKSGATFINAARGGLVCEPEMIAVLAVRPDLQAVLDVTWPEPPPSDSPLYQLPNVFLTPHIAGSVGHERRRMGRAMVAELQRFLRGEPLQFEVDREKTRYQA